MDFGIKLALKSVRTFSHDRRVGGLDGRLLPAQLLGLDAPPAEIRAVAAKITNRLPIWQSVRGTFEELATELEARTAKAHESEPLRGPGISFLYSPWG